MLMFGYVWGDEKYGVQWIKSKYSISCQRVSLSAMNYLCQVYTSSTCIVVCALILPSQTENISVSQTNGIMLATKLCLNNSRKISRNNLRVVRALYRALLPSTSNGRQDFARSSTGTRERPTVLLNPLKQKKSQNPRYFKSLKLVRQYTQCFIRNRSY